MVNIIYVRFFVEEEFVLVGVIRSYIKALCMAIWYHLRGYEVHFHSVIEINSESEV